MIQSNHPPGPVWIVDKSGHIYRAELHRASDATASVWAGADPRLIPLEHVYESEADAVAARARYCAEQLGIYLREYVRLTKQLHDLGEHSFAA